MNSVQLLFCQHSSFPISLFVYQQSCCFQLTDRICLPWSGCPGNWHWNFLWHFPADSYL